ncbi:MAG: serine hydroxymethyltransferase, partial [Lactococcus lactis]
PDETLSPFKTSGVRIGAAAITSRGFKEVEAKKVAQLVSEALVNHDNQEKLAEVRKAALELTRQFPL